jgi:AraC-like DNA-binding protein/tetratricopeptide (TPR) repeat protein
MTAVLLPRDVQQALALLKENPAREHSVKELAKTCGVAPRTLQQHFRQFLGQSPLGVLRDIRLDFARHELLLGRAGTGVTELAARVGFGHLGRFSGWYHERYGEVPSETLRRVRDRADRPPSPSLALPFPAERPGVAVLPFHFTGPPVRYGIDLAQEFALALARLRWLPVGTPHDARYHLHGTVHVGEAGQLRIKITLLNAQDGRCLWADLWTGEREDTFTFEEQVARRITAKLQNVIRELEIARAWRKEPEELEAWDLAMRALSRAVVLDSASLTEGLELAEMAIELTPLDALPLALASWCRGMNVFGSPRPTQGQVVARAFADRAARLVSGDPIVHALLAGTYAACCDFEASNAHVEQALSLDGGCAWAWQHRGWSKIFRGHVSDARASFQIANDLAPVDRMHFLTLFGFASVSFEAGRYTEAVRWWKRGMAESPSMLRGHRFMAPALALSGHKDEARASLAAFRLSYPEWALGTLKLHSAKYNEREGNGFELIGVRPT